MKENAVLVNTARAGLVDEDALIIALGEHKIKAAMLDVFKREPLPDDHILHRLDNVVITPPYGWECRDVMLLSVRIMMEEILRYLKKKRNFYIK